MYRKFSRPAVDLGSGAESREWCTVRAASLAPGDIVPDFGKVLEVVLGDGAVRLVNISGETETFSPTSEVFAFTQETP